jgi:hypothetical protein
MASFSGRKKIPTLDENELRNNGAILFPHILNYKSHLKNINLVMETFQPSIYLAMFPYLFIASFPIFGLVLVTRWVLCDRRKKRPIST